jgi:hypothetical protein
MAKAILTPAKAYQKLQALAKKKGVKVGTYAQSCGVRRDVVSKWKDKHHGTIALDKAQSLGIV